MQAKKIVIKFHVMNTLTTSVLETVHDHKYMKWIWLISIIAINIRSLKNTVDKVKNSIGIIYVKNFIAYVF